ncbi:MAG: O-methyltransferase [Haliscomenobacter sp.]|nr:O-methyltransferase [Haliscomenobacter sp.]
MQYPLKALYEYCEQHSAPIPDVLYALERETHLKTLAPQMMSGPLQGAFLRLLSRLVQPANALEIGTFSGYGALCLADGLRPGGVLHTIEANPELELLIRKYIRLAGREDAIRLYIGKAQELIPSLPTPFDLVFIDAGKQDYALYFDLVVDRVRPGGLILADNVLWGGKILDASPDLDTRLMRQFNEKIAADPRVETLMLPLRDGLSIMQRKMPLPE